MGENYVITQFGIINTIDPIEHNVIIFRRLTEGELNHCKDYNYIPQS